MLRPYSYEMDADDWKENDGNCRWGSEVSGQFVVILTGTAAAIRSRSIQPSDLSRPIQQVRARLERPHTKNTSCAVSTDECI